MESGPGSSLEGPNEWWGADETLPHPMDEPPLKDRFMVPVTWSLFHQYTPNIGNMIIPHVPEGYSHPVACRLVDTEIEIEFMTDKTTYYIVLEPL